VWASASWAGRASCSVRGRHDRSIRIAGNASVTRTLRNACVSGGVADSVQGGCCAYRLACPLLCYITHTQRADGHRESQATMDVAAVSRCYPGNSAVEYPMRLRLCCCTAAWEIRGSCRAEHRVYLSVRLTVQEVLDSKKEARRWLPRPDFHAANPILIHHDAHSLRNRWRTRSSACLGRVGQDPE
jgi:hypothetical protein